MTYEGLGDIFKSDFADKYVGKFLLKSMGSLCLTVYFASLLLLWFKLCFATDPPMQFIKRTKSLLKTILDPVAGTAAAGPVCH